MPQSQRHFSTKSLTLLANDATTHLPPNTLDNFLATLSAIDEEIHSELSRTRTLLATTTKELDKERALRQAAEHVSPIALQSPEPTTIVPSNQNILRDASPTALLDLLLAREDAFRQQSSLVDRLKAHNSQLRNAYQTISHRLAEISPHAASPKTTDFHSGIADTSAASKIENDVCTGCRQSRGTESCDGAAADLLKTIDIQRKAHEKLRATVAELTSELERIDPSKVGSTGRSEENLQLTEQRLSEAEAEISEKDVEIAELKRQLTKVLAEYEAVSVAHSYSNAELSKIRANGRGKPRQDRPTTDRLHAFGTGVENLLNQRKNHFR